MVGTRQDSHESHGAADADAEVSCASCEACCCRLEVLLMSEDDVPLEMVAEDKQNGWAMARLADGLCVALDRSTFLCTIYERRPGVCRDYQAGDYECRQERLQLAARRGIRA